MNLKTVEHSKWKDRFHPKTALPMTYEREGLSTVLDKYLWSTVY